MMHANVFEKVHYDNRCKAVFALHLQQCEHAITCCREAGHLGKHQAEFIGTDVDVAIRFDLARCSEFALIKGVTYFCQKEKGHTGNHGHVTAKINLVWLIT